MSDNSAEVKLGANTSELNGGMTQAETKVNQSTTAMTSSIERMAAQTTAAIRGMNSQVNSGVSSISGAVGKMNGMITGVTTALTALAAGAVFSKVISATTEWTGQVVGLSKSLGITTEEASGLAVGLQRIGVSTDTYASASQRLNRQVITNEAGLKALGMETRDGNDKILDQQTLMKNAIQVLAGYEEGTSRNMMAQKLFGRGAGDVSALMKILKVDFEEAKRRAEELGLVVGPDGAAKARQYKESLRDVELVGKSLAIQFGNQVLPAIVSVGSALGGAGASGAALFGKALKEIVRDIQEATVFWAAFADKVKLVFSSAIFNKDKFLKGYKNIQEAEMGQLAAIAKQFEKPQTKSEAPKGGNTFDPDKDGKGGKEPKSRMSDWENELKQRQIDEKAWFGISLSDERAFWEQKKSIANSGSGELQSVVSKINETIIKEGQKSAQDQLITLKEQMADNQASWDSRLKAAQQYVDLVQKLYKNDGAAYTRALNEAVKLKQQQAEEIKKIQESITDNARKLADIDIQIEEEKIQWARSIGAMSEEQEIAALRELYNRKRNEDIKYLQDKLALEKEGTVAYQEILNKISVIQKQHDQKMSQLNLKSGTEMRQRWNSVWSSVTSSFSSAIQGMLTITTSFKDAMLNISKTILNAFVDMGVQMAADWIKQQFLMLTTKKAAKTEEAAITAVAVAEEESVSLAADVAEIEGNAGVAASGAAAAEAGIPYVGPALAVAAAAAMMALVMGFSSMASASGGWGQIPEDQISMVHKDEMILPADLASGIRSIISGGRTAGVSNNSKTNINIRAFDSKDVVKTMRKLHRNNSLTGK